MTLFALKLGLVSFWGLWLLIVFLTNLFEWLKVIRILSPDWKFTSQNYEAVARATARYHSAAWLPRFLFLGILLWQLVAFTCFSWAMISSAWAGSLAWGLVNVAFAASIGLLAAFIVADEIFKEYELERGHNMLFIAHLVTLILLYVLPS
jgi:hypothetical protein